MLNRREVEVSILERLKPLSQALAIHGVKVRGLPQKPREFATEEARFVSVLVTQARGQPGSNESGMTEGSQEISYMVSVKISLSKLYPDLTQQNDALDWATDTTLKYLLGFIPFANKTSVKRSLKLESFDLLQPSNGQWEAILQFSCTKIVTFEVELPFDDNTEVDSVQIFSSRTLDELDATLILDVKL